MIELVCPLSGCYVDYSRADPAELYYYTALGIEILAGTIIAGLVTLKLLWKYRMHFKDDTVRAP